MEFNQTLIRDYLNKTRFIVLATVRDGKPALRTMASFATDGFSPVFSTHKDTDKVRQIEASHHVSVLFEHENQSLRTFVNITVSGVARRVDEQEEQERIIALIGAKNPRYLERAVRGELIEQLFYRVDPNEMTIIDFGKSPSPGGVQRLRFSSSHEIASVT